MVSTTKTVAIQYYAILREQRGLSCETIVTSAQTARELYAELVQKYSFALSFDRVKVAVNDQFTVWDVVLKHQDSVVFLPPVAGG